LLPRILKSDVPPVVKFEAWYHLTGFISNPLTLLLSLPILPAIRIWPERDWLQFFLINLPVVVTSTLSITSFYLLSQKELYPGRWLRTLIYLPVVMAVAISLLFTNCRAWLEAVFGRPSSFVRTPKYRVTAKSDRPLASKYRKRLGLVPWIELALGAYFLVTLVYAVRNGNFLTAFFLLFFVSGYWYSGAMSLLQGRCDGFLRRAQSADSGSMWTPPALPCAAQSGRVEAVCASAGQYNSGRVTCEKA
jgi:hypothetical protein